ncbi:Zinc finger MYND domain-containing protein 10 [Nowakowskiella sp. JEL0078]|nr:Zinc finger MYND domain-containing protein 10 [Nowakowskiella sp. JEL0078]
MIPPLACLIGRSPWFKRKSGGTGILAFENGNWKECDPDALNKCEAQVWLCLYNFLMEPICRQKYNINDSNKESLLSLRPHLTTTLFDQLPILPDLLRYLEELSIMQVPNSSIKSGLLVESIPEIRIEIENRTDWKELAKNIVKRLKEETEDFELFFDYHKCAKCGKPGAKRCSRCRNEWYCSRGCQVNGWKQHKAVCDLLAKDSEIQVSDK